MFTLVCGDQSVSLVGCVYSTMREERRIYIADASPEIVKKYAVLDENKLAQICLVWRTDLGAEILSYGVLWNLWMLRLEMHGNMPLWSREYSEQHGFSGPWPQILEAPVPEERIFSTEDFGRLINPLLPARN